MIKVMSEKITEEYEEVTEAYMKIISVDTLEQYYMIRSSQGYLKNGAELLYSFVVERQKDGDTYTLNRAKEILEKLKGDFYIVLIEVKEAMIDA